MSQRQEPVSSGYGLSAVATTATVAAPALPYLPPRPRAYRPKIGLIGCGGIAEYHLRAYQALGLEVAALCDCEPARAGRRRDQFYPGAAVAGDYREVLGRGDIEVVDVATHPEERVAIIEAALHAGKHVLSQKPFVLDLAVGRRLVALADEKGLKLAVNQNGRWAPHFSYLAQAVRAGLIGQIASVDFTVQWDHSWTTGTPFENIRHLVLYDFGVHWFDIAGVFLGGRQARTVAATVARTGFQQARPPFLAQAMADYGDAQVRFAFNAAVRLGPEDRTVICGADGTLRSFGPSLTQQTVVLHNAAGAAVPVLQGNWFENGFQGTMGELLCAIEDSREPANSARHNLASLELCFAAVASADAGGQPRTPGLISALPAN